MPSIPRNKRFHQDKIKPFANRGNRTEDNSKFYKSRAWQHIRLQVLMSEPLCRSCYLNGIDTPAQVVDHVRPISDGGSRTDSNNLQPLCNSCHNRKSGREGHNDKKNN